MVYHLIATVEKPMSSSNTTNKNPMLAPIQRPTTLKDAALNQLRDAITLGYIQPGERLIERNLCERLGVSRSVVRECIRHLESEHLVDSSASAGPSVAILQEKEVLEIYKIRQLLESAAIKNCAENPDSQLVETLEPVIEHIAKSLINKDILQALTYTTQFYEAIFMHAGMSVSWGLVIQLKGRVSWLRARTLSTANRVTQGPENLRKIVAGIKAHNPKAAVAAVEKHIEQASSIAIQQM